jgi:iron complex outermembrane receptor protein
MAQTAPSSGQAPVGTTEIEVTGSRLGAEIRPITVLTREEIESIPALDAVSVLRTIAGVDLRERAPFGGQADLGLYGGNFEEVLVVVDGFPINDPQTGHHALELLPPLEAIERIEILRGPASVLYGPGAIGGVVQIFTHRPSPKPVLEVDAKTGEHRLARGGAYISGGGLSASGSILNAAGYAGDTEIHEANGFMRLTRGSLDALLIYQDKRFGAWQAYSGTFPDEWEAVSGTVGRVQWASGAWQAWVGFRHKLDHFVLDRAHPWWYDAQHTTDRWSGQVARRFSVAGGAAIVGVDLHRDTLDSEKLGRRGRSYGSLFGEGFWTFGVVQLDAGLRAEVLGAFRSLSPQISVQWPIGRWRGFVSASYATRSPSFTELYTDSPAWKGNPDLAPERASGVDTGIKGTLGTAHLSASVFQRRGRDLIDLVRPANSAGLFHERNAQKQDTSGLELKVEGPVAAWLVWRVSAMILSQTAAWPAGLESRYADDGLRHKESAGLEVQKNAFSASLGVNAWQRNHHTGHGEVDAALAWAPAVLRGLKLSVEGRNLTDNPESGFFGAPGPGRWLWVGLAYRR